MQVPVNYLAVLVCGVAAMVLGYVYYGPLFGKLYGRLMGFEAMGEAEKSAMMKTMMRSYAITFVASLVTAWVMAHAYLYAAAFMGWSPISAGIMTGLMSWLGFMAPVTLSGVLWGKTSWKLWFLQNGHNVLQLVMFGVILGWMK